MSGITNRTIILLGGNILVTATADLTADLGLNPGSAVAVVNGSATLTFQSNAFASPSQGQLAQANLSAGTILASVNTAVRQANSNLSASVDATGSGRATFNIGVALATVSNLVSAGGRVTQTGAQPLTSNANMLVVNPGILYDASAPAWSLNLSMSVSVSPVYRLVLPTRKNAFTRHKLFGRYLIDTGVAMLIKNGAVTFSEAPSDNELKDSDQYFLGGYRHQINSSQRAVIVAAGYGALIEEA